VKVKATPKPMERLWIRSMVRAPQPEMKVGQTWIWSLSAQMKAT
jgi:hypothetical protein